MYPSERSVMQGRRHRGRLLSLGDTPVVVIQTMLPSTRAYGGTRMGDNRETNVVDRWGFSHEVPNLGILGASVMGTSGAHNPTLTAQAWAWRTAERL
jgi:choline dehydrogenase-like flavoprotein